MIEDVLQSAKERMAKSVEALVHHLARIRTGRAHASLLDQVRVDYYGTMTPVSQIANIMAEDARTLKVTPWEKNMVGPIEKAIMQSDIGITPTTIGTDIRLPLPMMTEERRKEMIKIARAEAEQARVSVRNVRRDANADLKDMVKEKMISEDDEKRAEADVQKITDQYVAEIDKVLAAKEKELLEV